MGSGLYGIGISGLLANQYALEVTSQNLANVNTPGYSRQLPLFQSREYNGNPGGIEIMGRQRIVDSYISSDLRNAIANNNQMRTYFENAERMDTLFSNEISDLSLTIQDFFASLQNLNNDPASYQTREVFINEMDMLVNRFHAMSDAIDDKYFDFTSSIETVIEEVNTLLSSIANINNQLNGGDGSDSALLDARDQALERLAQYIAFSVNEHDDGRVDVNIGKGNSLVLGAQASLLATDMTQGDFMMFDVMLKTDNNEVVATGSISGGILGGLLLYRNEILSVAHAEVGRIAMAMADHFNQQNTLGMDMNSELGTALFNDINDASAMARRVIPNKNNTGVGSVNVGISDISQLHTCNYDLKIESGNYTLIRRSDNSIASSGTLGTIPTTLFADGMEIHLDAGSFNNGDNYMLTPTRYGANEIELRTRDVNKIALASPLRTQSTMGNTGDVRITHTMVTDTTNSSFSVPGNLNPPLKIEFISDTSYQIVNANTSAIIEGPITYDPSIENSVFPTPASFDPGYQITLAGIAKANDSFTVDYNSNGISDNRNGYALIQLQQQKLLNNGNTTLTQTYQQFSNKVATKTHFADLAAQTSSIVHEQALQRRDNLSGVNIDEEAANLLRYQQAYQASAQLLSMASSMFDILLEAVGR